MALVVAMVVEAVLALGIYQHYIRSHKAARNIQEAWGSLVCMFISR